MRKPKSETVAENLQDFLAGKSEDYKNKFMEKSLEQQYIAIANWKRNAKKLGSATKDLAKVSAATVMSYLKEAHRKLVKLDTISPKESQKIQNLLDNVKSAIDNFDIIKKKQLLEALQSEKEKLAKQNENLELQIQKLQNEIQ